MPRHLPIKVELKNLEIEPLLRNLQIKVTNTANKPIYFLELDISLPSIVSPGGNDIVFPLRYGRTELIDFDTPVRSEDTPIRPSESHVFTIPKENLEPFEDYAATINLTHSGIRRIYLFFQQINFGDKTGFVGTDGATIPNIRQGQTSNNSCEERRKEGQVGRDFTDVQLTPPVGASLQHFSKRSRASYPASRPQT